MGRPARGPGLAIAAWALAAALASCGGRPAPAGAGPSESPRPAPSGAGIVAEQDAPLYADSSSDPERPAPGYSGALDFGTPLALVGDGGPRHFAVGGQTLALVEVRAEGGSAGRRTWVRAAHYADGAEPAAVLADGAAIRDEPSAAGRRLATLPRASLVAVLRAGGEGVYLPALVPLPEGEGFIAPAYVEAAALSFAAPDLAAARAIAKARAARDTESRNAILVSARAGGERSSFAAELSAPQAGPGPAAGDRDLEWLAATLYAGRGGARILAEPRAGAATVASLAPYEGARVSARSAARSGARGREARWYRIESPAKGWIFGLELDGAD